MTTAFSATWIVAARMDDGFDQHEASGGHDSHFHISFRTPDLLAIQAPPSQPAALTVASNYDAPSDTNGSPDFDARPLVNKALDILNLQPGDATVFTLNVPNQPGQYSQVMVAQAGNQATAGATRERAIGICYPIGGYYPGMVRDEPLTPQVTAADYFYRYEGKDVKEPPLGNVTVLTPPKHGKLEFDGKSGGWWYTPAPGYVGDEIIEFRVIVDNQPVRIVHLLKVQNGPAGEDNADAICRKTGTAWKISSASDFLNGKVADAQTAPASISNSDINAAETIIATITHSPFHFVNANVPFGVAPTVSIPISRRHRAAK